MGRILYSPPICVGAGNLCHMVVADSLAVMATGRAWGPGAGGGEGGSGGAGRARWLGRLELFVGLAAFGFGPAGRL